MKYYHQKKQVIATNNNIILAVATHEIGAEVIAKALNYYFGDVYTRNQSIEMMHQNTAMAFNRVANFFEKYKYDTEEICDFLRETAEEMDAQALVVSMRDELKFGKPID